MAFLHGRLASLVHSATNEIVYVDFLPWIVFFLFVNFIFSEALSSDVKKNEQEDFSPVTKPWAKGVN